MAQSRENQVKLQSNGGRRSSTAQILDYSKLSPNRRQIYGFLETLDGYSFEQDFTEEQRGQIRKIREQFWNGLEKSGRCYLSQLKYKDYKNEVLAAAKLCGRLNKIIEEEYFNLKYKDKDADYLYDFFASDWSSISIVAAIISGIALVIFATIVLPLAILSMAVGFFLALGKLAYYGSSPQSIVPNAGPEPQQEDSGNKREIDAIIKELGGAMSKLTAALKRDLRQLEADEAAALKAQEEEETALLQRTLGASGAKTIRSTSQTKEDETEKDKHEPTFGSRQRLQ